MAGKPVGASAPVRCSTRALKNARHLQELAPDQFAVDPAAEGFGTGVPMEILRGLHRISPDSPVLNRHKAVSALVRKSPLPVAGSAVRDALFSGTIHFAQVTFQAPGGNLVIPTADMNQIVRYAQHAVMPISEYAALYGPNTVAVSATLLTHTVNLSGTSYTQADLVGWVNTMAASNSLPANSCIFVVSPQGLSSQNVGGNAGYHGKANIPYVVAGVFASGLTLADSPDVYAMVVSHEIAEMIVDPNVDGANPEVCDPCDLNCSNLTRCYFDASDNYLGSNQASPPSGFSFAYYICAVVKPAGATACPASAANCAYAPPVSAFWTNNDLTAVAGGPPAVAGSALTSWADSRYQHVICLSADQHVHELYYPLAGGSWANNDLGAVAVAGSALTSWADSRYQHVIYLSADQHVHELYYPIS